MNEKYVRKWFSDDGDNTLRLDYPLNSNSLVFDLGGYEGGWTSKIYEKYECNIYVFEPIPELYSNLINKFKSFDKIKVFPFGVSDEDKTSEIFLLNDASSFHIKSDKKILTKIISITKFLNDNNITNIDLIKINIEGDEFSVLKTLLDNHMINIFENIQVQFHRINNDSVSLRNSIRDRLASTHKCTYNYEFVWENWEKINNEK